MSGLGHVLDSEELSDLANELTGGAGIDDGATTVPDSLASDIEAYDQHRAEQGLELEPDDQVDDHRTGRKEVPLSVLHQERVKRQALQEQVAAQQAQVAEMNRRFAEWQQQQLAQQQAAQQAAEEAAVPSFEEDPQGYILAKEAQFKQQLEQIQGQQARQQAEHLAAQVTHQIQQIAPELDATERQFEAEHPEYREAFDFMDQQAEATLRQQAPNASPAEIALLKTLALTDLAMRCRANGQNPCEVVMRTAAERGFVAGQQGWRQPAAPRAKAPTSLGSLHGAVEPGAPTFDLQTIASLSDEAFEQAWAEMSKGAKPRFAF